MKIRIKGNSLRMRLTRSEIKIFAMDGYLEEKIDFGDKALMYAITKSNAGKNLSATFSENKIVMCIPEQLSNEWTKTEKTGFEYEMETGNGKKLMLILEKDFKCLDQVNENQDDQFENPLSLKC